MEKYRKKKRRCGFMAILMIAVGGVFIFSFMMMAVSKESVTKAAGKSKFLRNFYPGAVSWTGKAGE